MRRKSRVVKIGSVCIGGKYPVAIQSMVKTKTSHIEKAVQEIQGLKKAGCEIVRVAVRDSSDAVGIKKIKQRVDLPLVADIHFDWRLGIKSIESGADKIRLNPGNINKEAQIKEVVHALKAHGVPLRIGVNSGSVRTFNDRRSSMADKLVTSCLNYVRIVEKLRFFDIVLSLKGSGCLDTVEAYRKIAKRCDYPLHLGVTATGLPLQGAVKSSIAIGSLLLDGLGDTIRISLTDESRQEVKVAQIILESLGMRTFRPEIISCPTCGRCEVNLVKIVKELENRLSTIDNRISGRPLKVAVMGCVVNGPGEAREADIGIAFGKREGLVFKNGKPIKKVAYAQAVRALLKEMEAKWRLRTLKK
ncbi:MAG: 4-hydroxy-3-methylbut-2-en-1-yl diphosphate synthase [Omnitrophica WOR_2 bacterium SM23_72]|nr:MAG: 4-hydroxy-3-methylbut-2-en-1-yl diphosphate synthase [Omnitrophica WOR_2 bacterium SM23_72]